MVDFSYDLIAETKLNDCISVKKYKNPKTGLTVVFGDVEGPIVCGKFVLTTKAEDNDGLPHTLEHLISLGSENYPFKGVLDLVANRCLASGTNAWTDDDHTCFTIDCVGAEGFLRTLPIYLDHILYPLLTDEAFITEVHHVTGEATDGGVVYCEMQGVENTASNRTQMELMKNVYPDTGYAFHVGGLMKNLRESTTNEKIKEYHRKFYSPDNLTIIITGQVDPNSVFEALLPIEEKILSKGKRPTFENPWKIPLEPISETKVISITYPDDEETHGSVMIGFRGPKLPSELFLHYACKILLRYLSDTTTSPLERDMVEIKEPFASGVCFSAIGNREALLRCEFYSVPIEKIEEIHEKFLEVLMKIGNGEEPVDMKRLKEVIEKKIVENLSEMESCPHMMVAGEIISHSVYGEDSDFEDWFSSNKAYRELLNKDETFWIDLLKKYILEANHVVVKAYPSVAEKNRLATEEQERIEQRKLELGPDGLQKMAEILNEAKHLNDIPPPEAMITDIPIPSFDDISSHPVEIFRAPELPLLDDFPIYTEAIDIHSNFVYIIMTINTEDIPEAQRSYLRLFLCLLGQSPIQRGTEIVPYDEVVNQLEADTISQSYEIGFYDCGSFYCGDFSNHLFISLTVEPQKYDSAVKWLDEILNHTIFDKDRIRVMVNRLLNTISDYKRDGYCIVIAMIAAIMFKETSNIVLMSLLKQKKFLSDLLMRLDDENEVERILEDFETLRKLLMKPKNISLHIATNWKTMEIDFVTPFKNFFEEADPKKILKSVHDNNFIIPDGNLDENLHGVIVPLGSVESSFLYSTIPFDNVEDLPALMLFAQYFKQVEGPFYREIRGKGFSYCYDILVLIENGLLSFNLYMATNLSKAYETAKTLIEEHLSGITAWDLNLLESARTSLISEIVQREENIVGVIKHAVLSTFKGIPVGYNKELISKVASVTVEDLSRVGNIYVKSLFGTEARTAIVCHPDKALEIKEEFEKMGYSLQIETSLDSSILA
ncbi:uncharacterized protein C05D11.1-like [Culicoides brevitarsis]|uniref:uncharacterized protein C05D11.1-like n=1 Tax=Culicoides brevitarsis TaxID=469753 RepID=UPI00307C9EEA